ncbi:MAG: hypothetical protein GWO24_16680 [Akkermansiaceae bacterium]|nr:hypothetical protein [Akkermansiaceae bacterium]
MRLRLLVILTLSAIGIMLALNAVSRDEILPVADGASSATALPLDQASSQTAFQTATFGLG